MHSTIWTTPDLEHFFIIGDALRLAQGSMALRSAAGRQMQVDPGSVAGFEVSEADADAFATQQARELLRDIKRRLLQEEEPEAPPEPEHAQFKADLIDAAAKAVGFMADGLVTLLNDRAEALRTQAPDVADPQQNGLTGSGASQFAPDAHRSTSDATDFGDADE